MMAQQLFNPGPSSLRTARMLSYRVPKPTSSFAGPSPEKSVKPAGLGIPRLGRATGGPIQDSPQAPFTGGIISTGSGRADTVPMHVPSGAYVIPADIVSHIGDGNTFSGLQVLKAMFAPKPFGATAGPWGVPLGSAQMGKGVAMPHPMPPRPQIAPAGSVAPTPAGPAGPGPAPPRNPDPLGRIKHGGVVESAVPATPIKASGGEFVIPPAEVKRRGGGSLSKGHKILDAFVKMMRQEHIKTLKSLPGPAR
jgi:hypothetical protein